MGVKNTFLSRLLASSDKFSDEQIAQTINLLVEHAVKHQASDIHIEPHERHAQVRFRVDTILRSTHKLPLAALPALITKIKELADLKPSEYVLPQEGQYATLVGEDQFEIQVYTMPVLGGEKVVLHIASKLSKPPTLEALGFWGSALQTLQNSLTRSHGLLLVATPRRNGKTTTLHSMLQALNTPAVSIATVEQNIEYRTTGINQTQVRPERGISFYTGLQAALNQDPNIIMVGNVADKQTANASIQAATGGHLILGGIHADSAAGALVHLQALSNEPFLFAHAAKIAVSQRLIRKLCTNCREAYRPDHNETTALYKAFGISTSLLKGRVHELEKEAAQAGLGSATLATTASGIVTLWQPGENGCEACNHTGFRGTLAIVEVLDVTTSIQAALLTPQTATSLRALALKDAFIPLELDSLVKALRGQTTISEILRILTIQ